MIVVMVIIINFVKPANYVQMVQLCRDVLGLGVLLYILRSCTIDLPVMFSSEEHFVGSLDGILSQDDSLCRNSTQFLSDPPPRTS